jgi:FkbM family methyltransferase
MKRIIRKSISLLCLIVPGRAREFLMWPVASRLLGLQYREVIELKDGFRMWGSMEDILSREILFIGGSRRDLWEKQTLKTLSKLCPHSSSILIAGAHMGYLLLYAACRTAGSVHSFEPIPWLYKRCGDNLALNPELAKKIVLNNSALGDENGVMEIFDEGIRSSTFAYSGGHVEHNNVIKCPVTTIDTYAAVKKTQFDLVLLDIEGYEWFALHGAESTLQSKPKLILEISPRVLTHTEVTPAMIFGKLNELGYGVEFLDDYEEKVVPYSKEAESKYLKLDYINILATQK